jgi:hypothetical protein
MILEQARPRSQSPFCTHGRGCPRRQKEFPNNGSTRARANRRPPAVKPDLYIAAAPLPTLSPLGNCGLKGAILQAFFQRPW